MRQESAPRVHCRNFTSVVRSSLQYRDPDVAIGDILRGHLGDLQDRSHDRTFSGLHDTNVIRLPSLKLGRSAKPSARPRQSARREIPPAYLRKTPVIKA